MKENEDIKHTILFVDDEEAILRSLKRLFRRSGYEILTVVGGEAALEFLKKYEGPLSMIVSDQRMPGLGGAEFLAEARKIFPDAIRFLLTGYADMDAVIDSINKGQIHRYLTKPWNDDDLILQVRQGLEHYNLASENKRLFSITQAQNRKLFEFAQNLERKVKERTLEIAEAQKKSEHLNTELELTLYNTVRAFAALNDLYMPFLKGHGKRVGGIARKIGEKFGFPESEINQLEMASLLHDIGKSGYNEKMQKALELHKMNDEEGGLYKKHPDEGYGVIAFINRFEGVGLMVKHHHELYNGKGFPDMLSGDDIPIGARIIAVADIYDRICMIEGENSYLENYLATLDITPDHMSEQEQIHNAALDYIRRESFTKYDPDVVKAFLRVVEEMGASAYEVRKVAIVDLEPGMVTERALYLRNGRFLIPHKTTLTGSIISKLKKIHSNNEMDDYIYIFS